ncbi:MAG TPA: hypothetical protein VIV12_17315, partial [Streptosporangiaceae bacterium]
MNRSAASGWGLLTAGLALAVLASACGQSSPSGSGQSPARAAPAASLNVELDWVPNPDHVG